MKKFFSFVAAVLFAGSMMAGVAQIKFTEAVEADGLAENASFTAAGSAFTATITDPDNKMAIDANDCRFGTGESYNMYNFRLKTGGKSSSTKNFITLNIPEAGTLCLAVRTGSNSATDRNLVIKQGEAELYNQAIVETMANDVVEGENTVKVYPFVQVAVEAGEVILSYPTNGLNFYALVLITEDVVPAGTTCAEVYNMAKNDVVDLLNDVVVTYSNGANVWVKDETAAMLIYLPSGYTNNFKAGDVLSGVAGVVDIYQTLVYEVKPSADQAAAITITEGEAPAAEEVVAVTAEDINEYVILKGAAIEGAFTSDSKTSLKAVIGKDTITVYNNFKFAYTFEADKTYNITGVVSAYKGIPQVYFISAEEAEAEPIVIDKLTYGMVFTEDFAEWGAVDVLVTNQPIVGQEIVGDGYIVVFDILPENANDITGTYSALAESLDLEYSGITQVAGTDTIEIELADGEVAFQLGQYSVEAKAAQLAMAAELVDVDGNIYHVSGAVVVYYDFLPEEQGVENVAAEQKKVIKKIEMGNVVIEKNGVRYNVNGAVVR